MKHLSLVSELICDFISLIHHLVDSFIFMTQVIVLTGDRMENAVRVVVEEYNFVQERVQLTVLI